ncbi:hypothetical protein FRB91_000529 [Serendipita sp. 411]|nr:hypothetical protein FRB91_000529 [Serendipita sp. 411]
MSLSDDKKMSTPRKPDDYTQRMKNTLREQDQIFMEVVSRNAELEKRIKELEYENWQLRSIADSLKKDLKASGSKYKDLEDSIDHLKIEHESFKSENPLVFCLLDGDGCIFSEEYLKQGHEGGALAAEQLSKGVMKYLRTNVEGSYTGAKIVTMVFLSKTEYLETFTKLPQTVKVFFGGSHDNGYYGTLAALQTLGHRQKLVLVQSYSQIGREISALKLPVLDIPGLFMPEKLDRRPILKKIHAVSDSVLLTLDQQLSPKSPKTPSRKKKAKARHNTGDSISSIDQILYPISNLEKLDEIGLVEIRLPCVDHHFSDRGCITKDCPCSHEDSLTEAERERLKDLALSTPCRYTNQDCECPFNITCNYGHQCPRGARPEEVKIAMGKKRKSKSTTNQDELDVPAVPPAPPEPKPPVDPKWVWPPFPTPSPDVKIIPFHQFEPKGIVISLDGDSEIDGEGIKTVTLQTPEPNVDVTVFSAKDTEDKRQSRDERLARNDYTFHRLRSLAEERTEYWVSDPETATKIFLSSYFRDRGLMWSEPNARDAPLLLCFYFRFVLRNKLFAEKELMKAYEKALMVAERASIEMPYTYRISRAFPDKWGRACTNLWEKRYQSEWDREWKECTVKEQPASQISPEQEVIESDEEEEAAKLIAAEYDLGENRKPIKEKAALVDDSESSLIPEAMIEEVEDDHDSSANVIANGELAAKLMNGGEPHPSTGEETSVDEEKLKGESENSDSAELVDDWADFELKAESNEQVEDLWGTVTVDTIADCVDETTAESVPRSYIPIRGEKSTRLLIQIYEPDETAKDPLSRTLAKLVFQPWLIPNMDADSLVQPPSMFDVGEDDEVVQASKRNARSFDATKHNIYVYVSKEVVSECRVGMAIGGTWIQVAKRVEPGVAVEKPTGGKGKKGGAGEEWWYMEALDWALPGYWTNNEAHRDTTLPHNNADRYLPQSSFSL